MSGFLADPHPLAAARSRKGGRTGYPALSRVLLLTLLALLVASVDRAAGLAVIVAASWRGVAADEPMPDMDRRAAVDLSGVAGGLPIEPAAGPDETPSPGPLRQPTAAASICRLEAVEAIADELARREAGIDARELAIALREAAMVPVEDRVREQVARLEQLKGELELLLGRASREEEGRIAHLVKVYEAMKARSAAGIFETIPLDLLLPIVKGMRDTKVAAIVAEMAPDKARALTAALARRQELPMMP
jgi:flagellar motility protein MotE (MotC chaperone)